MTDRTYVALEDVLALLDDFTLPTGTVGEPAVPGEIIDQIHDQVSRMQPRAVPDGGRRIQVELSRLHAGDLRYIEATRALSGGDAMRWAIRTAARECEAREHIARSMARVLQVDLAEARDYVDTERDIGIEATSDI